MNKSRSLLMAAFYLNAQIYAGIIKPEEAFGALTPYGGIVKIELS